MSSAISPSRAIRYATGGRAARASTPNRMAGTLWLVLLILGIKVLRDRAVPTAGQAITFVIGAAVVVLAGTVAPDLVFWSMATLFIAAVLVDVPYLTPAIDAASARIEALNPLTGS